MKGVIYARYSCDNQREESIEGQLRDCKEYAKRHDILVVDTYIDRAFSAKTDRRPAFQQMIKDSAKRGFEAIIVWKLDRFARNRYDSATYKAKLRKNGVRVISANENISEGSEGILLESVLEGMAEYYSADLSEKVLRGHMENALKCKSNGGGIPIGFYVDEEKHYQIDPLTAPLVREAFESYADGKKVIDIAENLNRHGVIPHRGKKCTISTVILMLKNRKYLGEYKYRDMVVPGGIPRIVSDELFERVQKQLVKNKKAPARHKAEDDYLLTTKLFCGDCGSMMFGESGTSSSGAVYHYYKCSNAKRHGGCRKKSVRKTWIEDIVVGSVHELLCDKELIRDWSNKILAILSKENTTLPLLKRDLAEVKYGIDNLLNALQAGIITDSTKERLNELEERRKMLEEQIEEENFKCPQLTREQLTFWFERMAKYDITKKEPRQRLIDTFINAVFLYDDRILITFNHQNGQKTISMEEANGSDFKDGLRPYRVFITDLRVWCGHSIVFCLKYGFYCCRADSQHGFFFWIKRWKSAFHCVGIVRCALLSLTLSVPRSHTGSPHPVLSPSEPESFAHTGHQSRRQTDNESRSSAFGSCPCPVRRGCQCAQPIREARSVSASPSAGRNGWLGESRLLLSAYRTGGSVARSDRQSASSVPLFLPRTFWKAA